MKIPHVVRGFLCLIFSPAHLDERWRIFQKILARRVEKLKSRRRTDRERCPFIGLLPEIYDTKPSQTKSDAYPTKSIEGEVLSEIDLNNYSLLQGEN
jgi:hypothetical protein